MTGQFGTWSAVWNYREKPDDLKGAARTLDEADGSIPLENGILSAQGWTLLDDSSSLLLNEEGWICVREDKEGEDFYFLDMEEIPFTVAVIDMDWHPSTVQVGLDISETGKCFQTLQDLWKICIKEK